MVSGSMGGGGRAWGPPCTALVELSEAIFLRSVACLHLVASLASHLGAMRSRKMERGGFRVAKIISHLMTLCTYRYYPYLNEVRDSALTPSPPAYRLPEIRTR